MDNLLQEMNTYIHSSELLRAYSFDVRGATGSGECGEGKIEKDFREGSNRLVIAHKQNGRRISSRVNC